MIVREEGQKMLTTKSIEVLERCLNLQGASDQEATRQLRLDELIADFTLSDDQSLPRKAFDQSWAFCVPTCFRAALDIKQTTRNIDGKSEIVWTQGPWFDFSEGDTFYDSVKAYKPWNLSNVRICLAVRKATPTQPAGNGKARSPGTVIFDILTPNRDRTELKIRRQKASTQDDFVRLLIVGPPADWQEFLND